MEMTDNIIICGANEFPHSLQQPFFSDYVGIIVCQQGMFRFCVDGASFVASEGETVFLSKGVMFQVLETAQEMEDSQSRETAPLFKYTLLFYRVEQILPMLGNSLAAMRLYSTIYPQSCVVMHTGCEEMLVSYAEMLAALENRGKFEESCEKEEGKENSCKKEERQEVKRKGELDLYSCHEQKLLLMAVTYRLCSIFSASFKTLGKEMDRKIEMFESLVKLIEQNFMRERSVAFYADKLCVTPKYLTVMVKSLCGKTVRQLLFKAIIRRSIYLMKNTNKTIQQIASELSFPNASAFGTFFKKHTGLSPKHYRIGAE